ncbi:hypothetical protein CVT26_004750 [Gymnopilus dilepis]|uniref:guanosine-diphosphatase n=1 Tax=Gymnopilus dilepis TaxID=231916 RepID=A0A409XZD8_9AGAR|nr:hypothetical protein CVT26_004750 [Gymnopilus dilepis]
MKPCSFNGVYQPSLLDSFPHGKVLLLSYFYDRLAPLLPETTPPPKLTVSTLSHLAQLTCLGPAAWASHPSWSSSPSLMEELKGRPEWCLDLTFMHALLRLGYEFGDEREVEIGKKVGGTELGWCLGAAIELVGGGEVKCRDEEMNVHLID